MKEFNLDAALNGEPVRLRGGLKAIVYYRIPDEFSYPGGCTEPYPLIGIIFNKDGTIKSAKESWKDSGAYTVRQGGLDIIGMWEEPKKQTKKQISIEDLSKPFKPKDGEIYYYIHPHETNFYLDVHETTCSNCRFDEILSDTGNCFRTKEDAQKWLDFMKSMME